MTCVVSFLRVATGGGGAGSVALVRKMEVVTVPGTTTATAEAGEVAIVYNGETSGVLIASGSVPNAQATSAGADTSAGFAVPSALSSPPVVMQQGGKINIKAIA